MRREIGFGLMAALAVAMLLSLLASQQPDGLQRVAIDHGFADRAGVTLAAPFAGYRIGKGPLSGPLAGVAGTLLTFGAAWGAGQLLRRRSRR